MNTNMEIIDKFKKYFSEIDFDEQSALREIYAADVVFKDPIHEIHGIEQLVNYFQKLNKNLLEGSFQFTSDIIVENKAFLTWKMHLKLKRPNKSVSASGITVLSIENKIIEQRDYFDAGEVFYEHVPILGGIIRLLKKKIAK